LRVLLVVGSIEEDASFLAQAIHPNESRAKMNSTPNVFQRCQVLVLCLIPATIYPCRLKMPQQGCSYLLEGLLLILAGKSNKNGARLVYDNCLIPFGLGFGKVFRAGNAIANAFVEPQFNFYQKGAGLQSFQLYVGLHFQWAKT